MPSDKGPLEVVACAFCHPLDGRTPGHLTTAACVHEHFSTLILCPRHVQAVTERTLWCKPCADSGHDKVPVKVLAKGGSHA